MDTGSDSVSLSLSDKMETFFPGFDLEVTSEETRDFIGPCVFHQNDADKINRYPFTRLISFS